MKFLRSKTLNNNKIDNLSLTNNNLVKYDKVDYIYSNKTHFKVVGVKDVNCTLKKNKIIAIIGASGSGKSTFTHLMNGILKPTFGDITVFNITKFGAKTKKIKNVKNLRQNIGSVFQFPEMQLFQDNVLKDIIFGPLNFGYKREEAEKLAYDIITDVGLNKSFFIKSPFSLSGGEKRRVALAGVLITKPKVLLLDEPTAGLDPEGEESFKELFKNLMKHDDMTIIIISHNMDHVLELADEVIIFKDGKILKHASPFEIFMNKKLILSNNLNLPFVYKLIHDIREQNPNFLPCEEIRIRTLDDLIELLKNKIQNN